MTRLRSNTAVANTNVGYLSTTMKFMRQLWKIAGIYFMWIFIHFISSHLYSQYCTPPSVLGLIMSPLVAATPPCSALRWCIAQGADIISIMWVVFGTWCATMLLSN
jgi:hypothetical protein